MKVLVYKKIFLTLLILVAIGVSFIKEYETYSNSIQTENIDRAIAAFAIAKSFNAVISVVQNSEISAGIGVGVTIAAGEILDPINDLVERFSWVMFASIISLGILKIILLLSSWDILSYLILLSGIIVIIFVIDTRYPKLFQITSKIFIILLLAKFYLPTMGIINETIYLHALSPTYEQNKNEVTQIKDDIKDISTNFDIRKTVANIDNKLEALPNRLLEMSALFIYQTILFPIFSIWFLFVIIRRLF